MRDALLLLAVCTLATLGFAALAARQAQHWRALRFMPSAQPPGWLRPVGWGLLGLSLAPALARDGTAFGWVVWIGMLTVAAMIVVALLVLRAGGSKDGKD